MAIGTNPLHPLFGVEILGIDVRRVDEATFADVVQAFDEHSVLLFRRQPISDEEQIAFSRRIGPLETTIRTIISEARTPREISSLANVDAEDRLIPHGDTRNLFNAGNQMWHSDSSFKRVPALASLLSAREVPPEGGEAVHSFAYSRGLVGDGLLPLDHAAQVPPVAQALVRANPAHGRKTFYVGSHACEILGMPTDEARTLLRELLELATRPEFVYASLAAR